MWVWAFDADGAACPGTGGGHGGGRVRPAYGIQWTPNGETVDDSNARKAFKGPRGSRDAAGAGGMVRATCGPCKFQHPSPTDARTRGKQPKKFVVLCPGATGRWLQPQPQRPPPHALPPPPLGHTTALDWSGGGVNFFSQSDETPHGKALLYWGSVRPCDLVLLVCCCCSACWSLETSDSPRRLSALLCASETQTGGGHSMSGTHKTNGRG